MGTAHATGAPDLRDPGVFGAVYGEHAAAVHAAAHAVLRDAGRAEDVVQDVFLRLWRRPDAYDPRRGPLGPYLRLMARSRALDLWREAEVRERVRRRAEAEIAPGAAAGEEPPDAAALRGADRALIAAAL